jgi:hypothetical protein
MTEFDFRKDWKITTGKERLKYGQMIKFYDMTRPEVILELRNLGIVSYKIEDE